MPLLSVIMPVYNSECFLEEAIESILNQTFNDFEFLIFNDGSTDKSWDIIKKYALKDKRIVAINSEINQGYVTYLNKGIELSKGKYIARMDSDDISLPSRFENQVSVMENDQEIVLCGTWFEKFGYETGFEKLPTSDTEIQLKLLSNNVFCHPSTCIRKEILTSNSILYSTIHMPFEDYHLWTRLAFYGKMVNIPQILLKYRCHQSNVSKTHWNERLKILFEQTVLKYQKTVFKNIEINEQEYELFNHILSINSTFNNLNEVEKTILLFKKIENQFSSCRIPQVDFKKYLRLLFFYKCTISFKHGVSLIIKYYSSGIIHKDLYLNLKFILKCIFKTQ